MQVLVGLGSEAGSIRRQVLLLLAESPEEGGGRWASSGTSGEPPRCPLCGAGLSDGARYRTVAVPPGPDEESKAMLSVVFVYCQSCGRTLPTHAGPSGP